MGRATPGVRIMKLAADEKQASMARHAEQDDRDPEMGGGTA
jgi:hypothetical protein